MTCYGVDRAFQHPDVRIGWYPMRTIEETELRTYPGSLGSLLRPVPKYGGVGRQSTRNPQDQPLNPHPRPEVNGWVWCYVRATGHTGWLPAASLEVDAGGADRPPLRGPGGYDFEVGRTEPMLKKPNGCGSLSKFQPHRMVKARTATLRYSARGTAFHYLHAMDKVKLLIVNAPGGYALAEVTALANGRQFPVVGTRGWIAHDALDLPAV